MSIFKHRTAVSQDDVEKIVASFNKALANVQNENRAAREQLAREFQTVIDATHAATREGFDSLRSSIEMTRDAFDYTERVRAEDHRALSAEMRWLTDRTLPWRLRRLRSWFALRVEQVRYRLRSRSQEEGSDDE